MFLRAFIFATILFIVGVSATEIDKEFLGEWVLDYSDDTLDDYLNAKGLFILFLL